MVMKYILLREPKANVEREYSIYSVTPCNDRIRIAYIFGMDSDHPVVCFIPPQGVDYCPVGVAGRRDCIQDQQ